MAGDAHIRSGPVRRAAIITATLAGVTCLAAACSGSPSSAPRSTPTNPATMALAYSKCMRSHGIKDFPDPTIKANGNGSSVGLGLRGGKNSDLNPKDPVFQAASRACRKFQPGGGNPPQQTAQELAADVKFAGCMRSHGFPSFPDPDGHGVFNIPGAINTQSSQFNSATSTCQSKTGAHSLSMRQTNTTPGGSGS
ncbi:MAG TPA: hypothetical protein VHU92_09555 [Streptosporangiaceae bacterium]|nr:hypothetical protein [Streptosporangiaceae bacterium]